MSDITQDFPYTEYTRETREDKTDRVIREMPLTVFVNDEELVTLLCSPDKMDELAVGFLWSESVVDTKDEIMKVVVDEAKGTVWVTADRDSEFVKNLLFKRMITSGCGKGTTFYSVVDSMAAQPIISDIRATPGQILALMTEFQDGSALYKATHGVHSAALCEPSRVVLFREDIGRHNAVDKILGHCLMNGVDPAGKILITSGRISSEVLLKAGKKGIPVIISRTSATDLALRLADKLNITLVGFVRGGKMNVYT
ncbi:MAG: formate dehydrogenase accessory sulfurtransferase FdhD, partial [Actinomycetota bacterium]